LPIKEVDISKDVIYYYFGDNTHRANPTSLNGVLCAHTRMSNNT